uniref:Uncharacterized protein LOC114340037 n=1 Tax=Diabrotica virgifera virgifera TaxID=50390 RepID=A0A6P7GB56_DIAVI
MDNEKQGDYVPNSHLSLSIPHPTQQNSQSYASITTKNQTSSKFPDKQQAVLFTSIDDVKIEDYLIALGSIVNPKDIIFASRISQNRICIYFSSKQLVDNFLKNYGSIKISNQILTARKLITPSQRIVLSGVCPSTSIPHSILEAELIKLGLNLLSPINFLKINASRPECPLLPHNEPTSSDIFTQRTEFTNTIGSNDESHQNISTTPVNKDGSVHSEKQNEENTESMKSFETVAQGTPTVSVKRQISQSTPPHEDLEKQPTLKIAKTKKIKPDKSIHDEMQPLQRMFEDNKNNLALKFNQTLNFFEAAPQNTNILDLLKTYTDNVPGFLNDLDTIYPQCSRKLKTKITNIKRKLHHQIYQPDKPTPMDNELLSSQESLNT